MWKIVCSETASTPTWAVGYKKTLIDGAAGVGCPKTFVDVTTFRRYTVCSNLALDLQEEYARKFRICNFRVVITEERKKKVAWMSWDLYLC